VVIGLALAVWAAALAWIDLRTHRVPNAALLLVLTPALLALWVNGSGLLGVGPLPSLYGLLIGGAVLMPGYVLGKMGAGDVKLAASMGLLLGPAATCWMLLVFAMLVGLLSTGMLLIARIRSGAGGRRIAAVPALGLGFVSQLFASHLPWDF